MEMFGLMRPWSPTHVHIPEAFGLGASMYENAEGVLYPTVPKKWTSPDDVKFPETSFKGENAGCGRGHPDTEGKDRKDPCIGTWLLGLSPCRPARGADVLMKMSLKERRK